MKSTSSWNEGSIVACMCNGQLGLKAAAYYQNFLLILGLLLLGIILLALNNVLCKLFLEKTCTYEFLGFALALVHIGSCYVA